MTYSPIVSRLTATGLALAVAALWFTAASAQRIAPPEEIPPHPIIQRDLTLTDMRVDVTIQGGVAHTTIRQTLRNDGYGMAEGKYMLPLPTGATVSDFALIDGDKRLEGEVMDAGEARRIYQQIVRQMRDPGLLEYQDHNTFSVSVFPFNSGETRSVEVSFTHTLPATGELQSYDLPLRWAGWSRCANTNFVLTYEVDSPYDLGTISSPNFGISVHREGDRRAEGSYEARMDDFGSDFTLHIGRRTDDFAASLLCFPGDDGEDGYFLLSLLAALPQDDKYVPKDVLFVFDKSGSMDGEKIEQAKGGLKFVVNKLKGEDRFNLIYYSDNVEFLYDEMSPATTDNIREARDFVSRLDATGGTDINTALKEGAKLLKPDGRPTYVIFLTDGLPTVGDTNIDNIVNNAKANFAKDVRLFVFGVGYDVNTTLLDTLSYDHHGSATYVSPNEDIEVKVSEFYSRMSSPALVDLAVELDGLQDYDLMPHELPDLFHNSEIHIAGRFRGTPDRQVHVTVMGDTQDGRQKFMTEVDSNLSSRNHTIPRLWATRKVSYLLDQIRLRGDNQELLDEVDRLAVRFGIVTPYTSYLITEPEAYFDADMRLGALDDEMLLAREEESGEAAVNRSKMNQANQSVQTSAAPQAAGKAAGGDMGSGVYYDIEMPLDGKEWHRQGSADPYSTVNYVNNQTFVRQDTQWVDARYLKDEQDVVQVTSFGSEYFELLDEYPELGEYLSQGEEVMLVVADDLVLQTVPDEVTNSVADLDRLKKALGTGSFMTAGNLDDGKLLAGIGMFGGGVGGDKSNGASAGRVLAGFGIVTLAGIGAVGLTRLLRKTEQTAA